MIKLSDVKVRPQYRTRVRYRPLVPEYAGEHGPAAAGRHYGLSARTIRRWRKRWGQGGIEGLVPSYPRHRARRVSPAAVELIASCGSTGGCITARASPSWPSSGGPSRSPSSARSVTTGKSSPSPLCWGSKPPGSAIDTFGPAGRNRTAKSSGAIGSIRRSSGAGNASRTSRWPLPPFGAGRASTTMNASPSLFRAAPRPKNLPRSSHHCGPPRHLLSARARHPTPGVNLDETQQDARRGRSRACGGRRPRSGSMDDINATSHAATGAAGMQDAGTPMGLVVRGDRGLVNEAG
jgi:hypothetical protein